MGVTAGVGKSRSFTPVLPPSRSRSLPRIRRGPCRSGLDRDLLLRCRHLRGRDRSHGFGVALVGAVLTAIFYCGVAPFRGRDRSHEFGVGPCRSGLNRDLLLRCRPFRGRDRSHGFGVALVGAVLIAIFLPRGVIAVQAVQPPASSLQPPASSLQPPARFQPRLRSWHRCCYYSCARCEASRKPQLLEE